MIGHLHCLWYWALDYAKDGVLEGYELWEIAEAALWEGDPDTFIAALRDCGREDDSGFLEVGEAGLCIHDWYDYAGKLIEKRVADAERKRVARMSDTPPDTPSPPVRGMSDGCPTDVAGRVPTVPNQPNKPNREKRTSPLDDPTVVLFHECCPSLPKILKVTEPRQKRIAKLPGLVGDVRAYFERVESSDFLTGRKHSSDWNADFDWLLKPANVQKVLEGSYDNSSRGSPKASFNVERALALVEKCEREEVRGDTG
jgi:hypothetical protein